jgi:ribosome-associated toxin RatA of RatAB toxin-antitoxin module
MVRVASSKIINLPQERVFSVVKEIGKLPSLFPYSYKSFNILEQSDNHILTEEIVSISGKEIKQKVKHILEPNRMLKSEIIEGDTKGTILIIELNPKSNSSTEIDAYLKFGKLGTVFGIFAKRKIINEINHIIDQFSKT